MLFFWTFLLKAQEPVVWVTDFKQLSDTEYLLIFKASMQPKWHLYSQTTSQRRTFTYGVCV